MNSDTGQIYRTRDEINAAILRGERLEPIGPGVAEMDKAGFDSSRQGKPTPTRSDRPIQRQSAQRPIARKKPAPILTDFDLRQLAAAEAKRQRKREKLKP